MFVTPNSNNNDNVYNKPKDDCKYTCNGMAIMVALGIVGLAGAAISMGLISNIHLAVTVGLSVGLGAVGVGSVIVFSSIVADSLRHRAKMKEYENNFQLKLI